MFAILKRNAKANDKHTPQNNPSDVDTPLQESKLPGASMKFQYGSGEMPLDGYKIKRGIGIGGFGEVYFAESDSGKEVALKRIQKNLDVEMRGVRHCLNLRHPNLVGIYDIRFDKNEQGWIVMEFIEGQSLRERMDQAPTGLISSDALPLFAQIAAGVAYLHDQGIVHRDLKPANIFIENGLAKIGDYGLSKYISASRRGGQTESVGTFHYMAPEIGKGEYGKEIDIYSLGIILYEMLTGNLPFDGESSQEIILKHLTADPDLTGIPQPFAHVIERSLAKNPANRFRDCREMLSALGYEIDVSGMAVRKSNGAAHYVPPVIQPVPFGAASKNGNADQGHPNASPVNPIPVIQPLQGYAQGNSLRALQGEPVARAIQNALLEFQGMLKNLPPGWRGIIVAFLIIFLVIKSALIAPIVLMLLMCYVPYYVVWYLSGGPEKAQAANIARPQTPQYVANYRQKPSPKPNDMKETVHYNMNAQPVAAPVNVKPLANRETVRDWLARQRTELSTRGFWTKLHASTRSFTVAGFISGILAVGGGFLVMSSVHSDEQQWFGGIAWLGVMTTLTSLSLLALTRHWESRQEDSIMFRFVQLVAGLALGAISYRLSEFLFVPWSEIASGEGVQFEFFGQALNRSWKGFYEDNGVPSLAGHMAYFGVLMWLVRWWRQADVLRRKRFSLWALAWSVAMAALTQGLFYFPGPWCMILAGTTSFVVQMASPHIDYDATAKCVA